MQNEGKKAIPTGHSATFSPPPGLYDDVHKEKTWNFFRPVLRQD
jgi:hypothetical protein